VYSSIKISMVFKSGEMRWVGHVARMLKEYLVLDSFILKRKRKVSCFICCLTHYYLRNKLLLSDYENI
jgi:hypothetical protein